MWRRITWPDLRGPLFALAGASALGMALLVLRAALTWRGQHLFLIWNLLLAWVPLLLALKIDQIDQHGIRNWRLWSACAAWLLFFPNAPYILTDLTHLKFVGRTRWWTDLIMILFFALIGLVLAFVSLHRMHQVVARRRGWLVGWLFVILVAFLSGFGVYLGRFERWNSWDVLINPIGLLADSFNWVHRHSAKFTVLFGLLLSTAYALLYSLTLIGPGRPAPLLAPDNESPHLAP
jgi:uncharacterized membrane protein